MPAKNSKKEIKTRIAPSPTGFLHIGLARTALFNYLFSKQNNGGFVLRIEDTDVQRSIHRFEKDIIEGLKWLGIEWSEGPDIGGNFGPYRQSERQEIYKKYIEKLLNDNLAYHCFCSEEELEAQRQYQMSIGQSPKYNGKCRQLSEKEVKKNFDEGKKSVIRLKVPAKKVIFHDLIRGKIEFDSALIGDIVIAKDLSYPLYNFVVAVDDYEMKITYVIRGEDHLSNTPKQILIQEALSFPQPKYAHLPLILGPGRAKLSKRDGAIAISEYKKDGYLPEALVNFISFLGWNPGTEREIYSMPSLIKEFSLERVQKGGAVFNIKRLDYLKKIITVYQERLKKISEILDFTGFFFKDKLEYQKGLLKWKEMSDREIKSSLDKLEKIISKIKTEDWKKENLEGQILPEAEKAGDRGYLLWPLRVALTGKESSAPPFEIAEILGKEKTLKRIIEAKKKL